jgi:GNAT superfamily N-acetyltransferase
VTNLLKISAIRANTPHLAQVAELWRANKRYLGFFPEVALRDYAERRGILGAFSTAGKLAGYLMFYKAGRSGPQEVRVVHVCVDPLFRNQGVARKLIEDLRKYTSKCRGASVRCRRDFPAHSMWPKVGFHPAREFPGKAGLPVTEWWLDYGHPDLLSLASAENLKGKSIVVLDACVFFEIQENDATESVESLALLADWIPDSIEFCVTPELRNEIARSPDNQVRQREMAAVENCSELRANPDTLETTCSKLRRHFPEEMTQNDESDLRQLAYSICAEADTFLTFDPRLRDLDDAIYNEFGLSIQRPSAFLSGINETNQSHEYRPSRLMGTGMEIRRVRADELDALVRLFQRDDNGEKQASLRERLSKVLSQPHISMLWVMTAAETPVFLCSVQCCENGVHLVEVLRTVKSQIGRTLADFLATYLIRYASDKGASLVLIKDPHISPAVKGALGAAGFFGSDGMWSRSILSGMLTRDKVIDLVNRQAAQFHTIAPQLGAVSSSLSALCQKQDGDSLSELESVMWPLRLEGTEIPAYVVPIKPEWASQLFDPELAGSRLLPADPTLLLRSENVYYTGAVCRSIEPPARILWYVSQQKGVRGSKAIRAVSTLQEIRIGRVKDVYKEYRRLGIYNWADVSRASRRDGGITALQFGRTEMLSRPISWENLCSTLEEEENRRNTFQKPTRIETSTFDNLYKRGTRMEGEK